MKCPQHNKQITHVCFQLPKSREVCESRLKCPSCCEVGVHPISHQKFTFEIQKFQEEDMSLSFFELFFNVQQIRSLFKPLQIDSSAIEKKLKQQILQLQTNRNDEEGRQNQQQLVNKIVQASNKINNIIKRMHDQYNSKYDWESVQQLFSMIIKSEVDRQIAEDVLVEMLIWIRCALKFIAQVYVVDSTFDDIMCQQVGLQHVLMNIKQELYFNLNHIRSLFFSSQPPYLLAHEQGIQPPLVTQFPLKLKKFIFPATMQKIKDIKVIMNMIMIIKEFEINVFQSNGKLQAVIYTKLPIIDASINPCDLNQVVILLINGSIEGYQLNALISVLASEKTMVAELGEQKYQTVNFVRPQKMKDAQSYVSLEEEIQPNENADILSMKSDTSMTLFDTLDGTTINEFNTQNSLVKIVFESSDSTTTATSMESENKPDRNVVCFRRSKQIDAAHSVNKALFENEEVIGVAFSYVLGHLAYLTENSLLITKLDGTQHKILEVDSKDGCKCMNYSGDQSYLFILFENSNINFYHSLDTSEDSYELEFQTQLFKNKTILQAAFSVYANTIYALTQEGIVYSIELSSFKSLI